MKNEQKNEFSVSDKEHSAILAAINDLRKQVEEMKRAIAILHGKVVNIVDTVTFAGESISELKEAFQKSVDVYLDFCEERGEDPEKPFSGNFLLRLDPILMDRKGQSSQATHGTHKGSLAYWTLVARLLEQKCKE